MYRAVRFFMALAFVVAFCGAAYAAKTDTVTVRVTVRNLSVAITEAEYQFGLVDAAAYTVATSAVTVTNDGNGAEDYRIQISDATGCSWTEEVTVADPGDEEYKLLARFNSAAPSNGDFLGDAAADGSANDVIQESVQGDCSTTAYAGDENGDDVAAAATRSLWFSFGAPATTAVTTEQALVVEIEACKPDTF